LTEAEFEELIGAVYDCAVDDALWTPTLTRISRVLDCSYVALHMMETGQQIELLHHSPWDPAALRALSDRYVALIPTLEQFFLAPLDTPVTTLANMSEAVFQQTEFYTGWAGPQGLRDGCTTKVALTDRHLGVFSTVTAQDRPPISQEEQTICARLSPHLRRAAMIGGALDMGGGLADMRARLAALPCAALLCDGAGSVRFANAEAEAIFEAGDVLIYANGRFGARNPTIAAVLADALARAAADDSTLGRRGVGIPLIEEGRAEHFAYVLPLHGVGPRRIEQSACVAVLLSTRRDAPMLEAALMTLYDLAPMEARLVASLSMGQTTVDMIEPARFERILAKTGAADIACLLEKARIDVSFAPAGPPPAAPPSRE
jgi:PAS domain-containing protein